MLPAPNLDDRRFQDLVDDAKRLVQRRCPEWTDHNVSDPGVTLIETFAFMTDQLLYRLNRVPDRMYVKFLELIGVRLFPPTPARALVTFWLSAPADRPIVIPTSTLTSTLRTDTEDAIVFSTTEDLNVVPCKLDRVMTESHDAEIEGRVDRTDQLDLGTQFPSFSRVPAVGDTMWVGLSEAVPACLVRLRFQCHIDGVGVDPDHPPLEWEAWTGNDWEPCIVEIDETGGINRDGDIILHIPASHAVGVFEEQRAGWLRARVTEAEDGQPVYSSSPIVHALVAETIGGTVESVNADIIENEWIGASEGVAGQRFLVRNTPVLAGASAPILEGTDDEEGWQEWTEVQDFASSGPNDRHFVFDAVSGEVSLGPAVRDVDGNIRQYGAVPEKGVEFRMRQYAIGGGRQGNVAKGSISVLRTSIPFVSRVVNREAAQGGVDGEDIEAAKARGPIVLRTRSRAVTAEDYEAITREAAPEVARVRCVTAGEGEVDAGSIKVLIVPAAPSKDGRMQFEELVPGAETFEKIMDRLDDTRMVGTRVLIEPPLYRGVTIVARLKARPRQSVTRIETEALESLYAYLNPLTGGPEGKGWPFGRPVQSGEIFAALQRVRGVELVEDVLVFGANPVTGERGQATQRLELEANDLVFSFGHQVRVEEA